MTILPKMFPLPEVSKTLIASSLEIWFPLISILTDQIMEIKKTSLSRIICDNNDGTVVTIQPNAFRTPKGYCTF